MAASHMILLGALTTPIQRVANAPAREGRWHTGDDGEKQQPG
jgi:hypothetical protein